MYRITLSSCKMEAHPQHFCIFIFILYISYLNFLRRVALRQKPFFKGPSGKKFNYNIQLKLNMTRIKKTIT